MKLTRSRKKKDGNQLSRRSKHRRRKKRQRRVSQGSTLTIQHARFNFKACGHICEKIEHKIEEITRDTRSRELNNVENVQFITDDEGQKWEKIKVKLDTGAIEWVFKKDIGKSFPIKESFASKYNVPYFAAEGSEIKNHGQKDLCGVDADWNPMAANVNMADIKSNLAGGIPIIQADNRIVLDKSGSYI